MAVDALELAQQRERIGGEANRRGSESLRLRLS